MAPQMQTERGESCFSRAFRALRRALARICGRGSTRHSAQLDVNDGDMILRGFGPVDSRHHQLITPEGQSLCPEDSELHSFLNEEDPHTLNALGSKFPLSSNDQPLCLIKSSRLLDLDLATCKDMSSAESYDSNLEGSIGDTCGHSSFYTLSFLSSVDGPPPPHCLKRSSEVLDFLDKKKHKDNSQDLPDFKFSMPVPPSPSCLSQEVEASRSRVSQDETLRKDTACPATLPHATDNVAMNSSSDEEPIKLSHNVPSFCPLLLPPPLHPDPGQVEIDAAVTATEEFMPDENDEDYRFLCSSPGLYECSVTGLVFHMEGEGDVVYRTVPWDRKLLAQHHKKPAGPLFDIKCVQQSLCRLHLPHCEISSTGGSDFLSVAHVKDEGIEFINPQVVTECHVVINITGFSGYGNVKDVDSPPDPVRAMVLLFYMPPADSDSESQLNVLLLPRNVVLRDVLQIRKKSVGNEIYLETPPHCKLHPNQEYSLSTCPEDNSVLVQPKVAEFDCDDYDNFVPSFQVIWEKKMKYMKLILRDTKSSNSVWERQVCLLSKGVKRSGAASALNLPPNKKLQGIRSKFINGISGPVLKSLLDGLFEKTVITDAERESAQEIQNKQDKARFVIDTVWKKGEAASSEMIDFLCEADPFLCEHLDLI